MMMAQVSGRAGRKGQRGKVFLQTKNKELPIIRQVVENDYQGFYKALLEERKLFSYPPLPSVSIRFFTSPSRRCGRNS